MVGRRHSGPCVDRKLISGFPDQWEIIDNAAKESGENRSEYMIKASLERAKKK